MHKRLERIRGRAADQGLCWGCCGGKAQEWAWVHGTDPADVMNYVALCVPCHRVMPTFDDADSAIRWAWIEWRYPDAETRPVPPRYPRIIPMPGAAEAEREPVLAGATGQGALF